MMLSYMSDIGIMLPMYKEVACPVYRTQHHR